MSLVIPKRAHGGRLAQALNHNATPMPKRATIRSAFVTRWVSSTSAANPAAPMAKRTPNPARCGRSSPNATAPFDPDRVRCQGVSSRATPRNQSRVREDAGDGP